MTPTNPTTPNSLPLNLECKINVVRMVKNSFYILQVCFPNSDQVGFDLPFRGTQKEAEEYAQLLMQDMVRYIKHTLSMIVAVETVDFPQKELKQ